MTKFTYETEIAVRFRDLDPMNQVHNATILVYVEEARRRYFRHVLGVRLEETEGALVHQEIDYAAPITLEDSVTVAYRFTRIGDSSLTSDFEVRTDDEIAAEGEVVHVMLDEAGTPRAVPDAWRERIVASEDDRVELE
ncbi:acyl-CoA thioesterase [Natribaculum luteum]|uniref:Acyl-CoA thioesterase n=1 Tax=Natribaculum luteum TaxID=1586232 RepID=A0ABD5P2H1_9EURY|nr:thioesterase family protein [Natribaculum luteum]